MEKRLKIGIPRALFYWKRPILWENFFKNLGIEVLLSPKTNKEIIENGVEIADPETCFASKVFFGHIFWLEGKVDYIFIPRLKRNELGLEFCPRFFGLPDVARISVNTRIISPWFDLKKEDLEEILKKIGKEILGKNNKKIKIAIEKSIFREREEKEKNQKEYFKKIQSKEKKIILISHPYNLYDDYVNLNIREKLENLGVKVILVNEIPVNQETNLPKIHWEFGQEMISQIREILNKKISGAIEISSFQCGCDAVLKEFIEREFRLKKIPFLYLLIDEHTAEAGLQTRLEAFIDTLK